MTKNKDATKGFVIITSTDAVDVERQVQAHLEEGYKILEVATTSESWEASPTISIEGMKAMSRTRFTVYMTKSP